MLEIIESYEDFFKTLGQETRIEILKLLARKKEIPQSEIWHTFFLEQPSIQHHLRALMRAGIISSRKAKPLGKSAHGKFTFYSLNMPFLEVTFRDFSEFLKSK